MTHPPTTTALGGIISIWTCSDITPRRDEDDVAGQTVTCQINPPSPVCVSLEELNHRNSTPLANLPTYTHPPSFDGQTQKHCGKKLQFIINMLTRFQYNHMHPVARSVSCAPPAAAAAVSSPPSLETQQTPVVVAPTTTSTDCALSVCLAGLSHFSKYDYRQCTIIAYYYYVRSLAAVVEGWQDTRMEG